jgi:hypothetical protein
MTQHSIEAKTLPELKQLALDELGLTRDEVKQHGDMRSRSTWLEAVKSALNEGKTTQEHQNLPILETTALQDNVTNSEPLSGNVTDSGEEDLPISTYLHHPEVLNEIEKLFIDRSLSGMLIDPNDLTLLKHEDERFCYYENWMSPGEIVHISLDDFAQTLLVDRMGLIYYINLSDYRIHYKTLRYFSLSAFSSNCPHSDIFKYVYKLSQTVVSGGFATINV